MPDFSGLIANAELSYAFRGMTRFTVGVSRDIFFSFEVLEPFYIQPGFTLSVTQQVTGPWDVQARAGGTDCSTNRRNPSKAPPSPGARIATTPSAAASDTALGETSVWASTSTTSAANRFCYAQSFEGLRAGGAVTLQF